MTGENINEKKVYGDATSTQSIGMHISSDMAAQSKKNCCIRAEAVEEDAEHERDILSLDTD